MILHQVTDEIRQLVRHMLAEKGMTQFELARRIGMSPQQLSRLLQGDSGKIPVGWQKVFRELGIELTAKTRSDADS